MKVAEGLLIGADQKRAEIIFVIVADGVQRKRPAFVVQIDELVDFSVAVARDVGNDAVAGRAFGQGLIAQESGSDWNTLKFA